MRHIRLPIARSAGVLCALLQGLGEFVALQGWRLRERRRQHAD
jgi:hypothetical protein